MQNIKSVGHAVCILQTGQYFTQYTIDVRWTLFWCFVSAEITNHSRQMHYKNKIQKRIWKQFLLLRIQYKNHFSSLSSVLEEQDWKRFPEIYDLMKTSLKFRQYFWNLLKNKVPPRTSKMTSEVKGFRNQFRKYTRIMQKQSCLGLG